MATTEPAPSHTSRGAACVVIAALCYLVSATASLAIFKDPAIAADFDGGTHTADMAGVGILAAVSAVLGGAAVIGALWYGPGGPRFAGALLVLIGLPVSWAALFTLVLSQALPTS
jgi:hypothetical protein